MTLRKIIEIYHKTMMKLDMLAVERKITGRGKIWAIRFQNSLKVSQINLKYHIILKIKITMIKDISHRLC